MTGSSCMYDTKGFGMPEALGIGITLPVDPVKPMPSWRTKYRRDYCGNIVYKDGEFERILLEEGHIGRDKTGVYHFYAHVKDYQGNIRLIVDDFICHSTCLSLSLNKISCILA